VSGSDAVLLLVLKDKMHYLVRCGGVMKVSVQVAKSKLTELIDAALAGEEVVIDKDSSTSVKIVPLPKKKPFKFGLLKGKVHNVPDFFEPMSEEDLALWEGGP
jgi:antitoxin (DNA-binding transcriptional repressor) of toxin-antitoxin stability system